jgi:anti-anti-sigma factor
MSAVHEPVPAAVAGHFIAEPEFPVIRERFSQDEEPNLDELLLPGGHARNAVLNMADVTSLDTRRIGWLLAAHKRFREAGGRLVLHSVRLLVREALAFLGLDRVLDIAEDEAAALDLLRTEPSFVSTE